MSANKSTFLMSHICFIYLNTIMFCALGRGLVARRIYLARQYPQLIMVALVS